MSEPRDTTLGLVLAGGRSTRMGRDKSLIELRGRPLITHVLARLAPQCATLAVSDTDKVSASAHHLPILSDRTQERLGPMAGIEAGLLVLADKHSPLQWLLSVPVDTPFVPPDLVATLHHACLSNDRRCAIAASGGRLHPTIGLWHRSLLADLQTTLHGEELRRVRLFAERHQAVTVEWLGKDHDPFFNINTPDDLAQAEKRCDLEYAG